MPFDQVSTRVDFVAQEHKVLDYWDRVKAFETRRKTERGKSHVEFPRRPDHGQQPDGRPPRLGPDLQGRLSPLLGNEGL